MTEVLDNLTTEGSDSDEIRKLFPKCKRKLASSDVNLNKFSDRVMKHMCEVVAADTTVPLPTNNMNQQPSPAATSTDNNNTTVVVVPRCKPQFAPTRDRGLVVVDPWLNDSCSQGVLQSPQDEFKLRESRIEIAGGREVFSASRSRHSRKRFSDEILYHGGPAKGSLEERDIKRHSGEVLYDEDMSRYRLRSSASACLRQISAEEQVEMTVAGLASRWFGSSQPSNNSDNTMTWTHDLLVDDGGEDMRPRPYTLLTQHGADEDRGDGHRDKFVLKGQKSGTLIYETLVRGSSEVVYDDIGECCDGEDSGEGSKATTNTPSPLSTGQQCHQQRNLSASTEAVNSEDFLSERDDAISSPEGAVSPPSMAFKNLDDNGDNDTEDKSEDEETESQRTARIIGSLPIAQYEGSPRRYGPRPGHPRRVCQLETNLCDSTCDHHPTFESNPNLKSKGHEQQQHVQSRGPSMKAAFNDDSDVSDRKISPVLSSPPRSLEVSCEDQHDRFETINNDGCSWRNLHLSMGLKLDDGTVPPPASDYDYLYEESETRKVLEEFYKQDGMMLAQLKESAALGESFRDLEYRLYRLHSGNSYVGRRLAQNCVGDTEESPRKRPISDRFALLKGLGLLGLGPLQATQCQVDVNGTDRGSEEDSYRLTGLAAGSLHDALVASMLRFRQMERERATTEDLNAENDLEETVSTNPDTEDPCVEAECEGDADGEGVGRSRNFTLSPDTTECDSNDVESEVSVDNDGSLRSESHRYSSMPVLEDGLSSGHSSDAEGEGDSALRAQISAGKEDMGDIGNPTILLMKKQICEIEKEIARRGTAAAVTSPQLHRPQRSLPLTSQAHRHQATATQALDYREVEEYLRQCDVPLPTTPSAPTQYRCASVDDPDEDDDDDGPDGTTVDLESLDPLRRSSSGSPPPPPAPHPHRLSDAAFVGREVVDEAIKEIKQAIKNTKSLSLKSPPREHAQTNEEKPIWVLRPTYVRKGGKDDEEHKNDKHEDRAGQDDDPDTDQETDRLLGKQRSEDGFFDKDKDVPKKRGRSKEVLVHEPQVLIEGVLFRARYLGSTQLVCEGQPTKATRMMQAEEAVSRIKAPEGETQPSTEVDLFISTEKIMVLNTDLKEIMMDHALRTISYIADIGDLVVLMARRRMVGTQEDDDTKLKRAPKMVCHVFESEEAQFIAQSIGQAFQVAYMEFLKANGIEDHSFVKEMDYQEVLNSQEIYGDELEMFAKKEMQKEVIVPKLKGEMLGVVIVESGWGSMLPTVVIANLSPSGAAARCGQLNIGDQIIAVNGISLVGLPLSTCQNYIKNAKTQTVVKLTVVPCAPVVEVKIKRPDTKYQLGFSVQNGVICSLLRGGIAERGGVRVGHRIIEINGQSVVAVPHERIVNLLATSVGEIHMKTMPTSMFRLLTGQESPLYI